LTEFLALWTRKKPSGYFLTLHQRRNETLKEFMARFNREKITIEDPIEDMVFATLYQGISPEELSDEEVGPKATEYPAGPDG
jgi:hypothetical protein